MCSKLTLVGHTKWASPLFLLNRLKLVILEHVHIEGLAKADTFTIPYSLLNPTIILLIRILQWQVLLFNDMFCSGYIELGLLKLIKLANIALIDHF